MNLGLIKTENIPVEKLRKFIEQDTVSANMTEVTLTILLISLASGMAMLAPIMGNAIKLFKYYGKDKNYSRGKINNAMSYLKAHKMIEHVADKGGIQTIRITKNGFSRLRKFSLDIVKIKNQPKWDGKWRIVMFDIPVRFSKARHAFRFKLKDLGFIQFQKSAWIYPHPCFDDIVFIADYFKVWKYVEIIETSSMSDDRKLKKYFRV